MKLSTSGVRSKSSMRWKALGNKTTKRSLVVAVVVGILALEIRQGGRSGVRQRGTGDCGKPR